MKSIFEEHGGKYIQCGDYLIPDLGLTEQEQKPLGKYGRIRREYLEKNRTGLYTRMILDGTLCFLQALFVGRGKITLPPTCGEIVRRRKADVRVNSLTRASPSLIQKVIYRLCL